MKTFTCYFFSALIISVLFFSCDGVDHEFTDDNFCYFWPVVTQSSSNIDPNCDALIYIIFYDSSGNFVSDDYFRTDDIMILMELPKSDCYTAQYELHLTYCPGQYTAKFNIGDVWSETMRTDDGIDIYETMFCFDDNCDPYFN